METMPHTPTQSARIDVPYFSERLQRVLAGIGSYTPAEFARELTRIAIAAEPDVAAREMAEKRGASDDVEVGLPSAKAAAVADLVTAQNTGGHDQPDEAALREAVLMGLVKLGHAIDEDCVTVYRTKGDEGNALHQLTEAVVGAVKTVVDCFGAVPPVAWRWRPVAADSWNYMHGQPNEDQRTWLSKFGHSVEDLFCRPKAFPAVAMNVAGAQVVTRSAMGQGDGGAEEPVALEATQ